MGQSSNSPEGHLFLSSSCFSSHSIPCLSLHSLSLTLFPLSLTLFPISLSLTPSLCRLVLHLCLIYIIVHLLYFYLFRPVSVFVCHIIFPQLWQLSLSYCRLSPSQSLILYFVIVSPSLFLTGIDFQSFFLSSLTCGAIFETHQHQLAIESGDYIASY